MDKQKPQPKAEINLSRPIIAEDDAPASVKDKRPANQRLLSTTKLDNGMIIEQY